MIRCLVVILVSSESLAKLQFSPDRLQANLHEVHIVELESDCKLPENTTIEIFPLPNEKAAEISPKEIVIKDPSKSVWRMEVTVKSYGVTSFIARVKNNSKPDESAGLQVKVINTYGRGQRQSH